MRGLRWSKTLACWYVPLNNCPHGALYNLLKDIALVSFSKVNKPFYENRETLAPLKNYEQPKEADCKEVTHKLTPEHYLKLENFKMWLQSKRYSANTIATYIQALSLFLRYFSEKTVEAIDNTDLISFNNNYILQHKLSSSFQNQVVNAVKLFFSIVENKKIQPQLIHRPKRAKVLPNVLSKEEVKALLAAPLNIKHKTMLSLIYACGLRCGELIRLTPASVDANRHLLIIKQSKGRKDRIIPLSDKILMLLRNYYQIYKPKTYLFEGQKVGEMYDERSLQQVLKNSVFKAKIQKPVTLHWLRHSYATHLLENGTDLRYIQEILGHSSSRTTEIYTHVSNKSIQKIVSPFDYL
ncbi:MAG: tyrosine-type recombinase/integrase [Bacteroidetes bacterium]|nr:tyrosine-type recombinase/integrase [Bacteroidota bacterium]